MAMFILTNAAKVRRERIKNEFWAEETAWTGEGEKGWFRAPRTLPLVLTLLSLKEISGRLDPGRVYLDLLARHRDSGIVDMVSDGEHSFAAGYAGTRGNRTWKERMKLLETLGFIKSRASGNFQYGQVLLVHPTIAVQRLRDQGKVPDKLWDLYRVTQIQTKEATYEERMEAIRQAKAEAAKKLEEEAKATAVAKAEEANTSSKKVAAAKSAATKTPASKGLRLKHRPKVVRQRKAPRAMNSKPQ